MLRWIRDQINSYRFGRALAFSEEFGYGACWYHEGNPATLVLDGHLLVPEKLARWFEEIPIRSVDPNASIKNEDGSIKTQNELAAEIERLTHE